MDTACSKMTGVWASAPGRGGRQAGPGGGKWSLTSGPLPILFHNEIKLPEIELIAGKIARMGEKFPEILWRKMLFGTIFVIAISSDSPRIFNYSQDFKSN
jgi:hypothetical protein